jgi:uncharacterized protein involved in high-affinity Fe2+ transport
MSGLALGGADWRASGALLPATAKDGPSDASSVRVDGPGTHKLTYPSPRPRRTASRDVGAQFRVLTRAGSRGRSQATRWDTGIPSLVIRFSTAQPARASVF